jgi:hypothetical protein
LDKIKLAANFTERAKLKESNCHLRSLLAFVEATCRGHFLAYARQKGTHCDPRARDVIHAQPAACKLEQRRE